MKANFLFAVCLASVLASGCTAASHGTQTSTDSGQPLPHSQTFSFPLDEAIAAGNRSVPGNVQFGPNLDRAKNGGDFPVEANATAILVEARFTCTSPTCSYYALLAFNSGEGLSSPASQGSLRWMLNGRSLQEGNWALFVLPDSANAGLKGEARVSVFYGGDPPTGFTAFA